VGGLEENLLSYFHQFVEYFEQAQIPGLSLITEIYQAEPHSAEGVALTYLQGIRRVYQDLFTAK
jgi:hypothetical protein